MNAAVNQLVEVANKQTAIIEYNSVPVMTSDQLAELYGTDHVRIQQNHTRNKDKFIEGKHFFKITGNELKEFATSLKIVTNEPFISSKTRSLILWTERGAARHAKILDTEQAWEVFEQLEDCYFNKKEVTGNSGKNELMPQTYLEALKAFVASVEQNELIARERDIAIATKAEIGNRREATAMATASKLKRQCEKLKGKLGEAVNFAAIAAINSKLKTNFGNKDGRILSKYSKEHGLEIKKAAVTGQRFNEVNSYHKDAWKAVFGIDLNDLFRA